MNKLWIFLVPVLLLAACKEPSTTQKYDRTKVINELIGDESYLAMYRKLPDNSTPEQERIKAHLAYAEQLLRQKDVSHLAPAERARRNHILDLLHEYMLAGHYPKNYDIQGERRPCFLDKDGNICAVGYLVEQTEGLALACKINSIYKYDWVRDMDLPELTDWVAHSGLTKEEFALIQPSYGTAYPIVQYEEIGIPLSAVLSLHNIALTNINIRQTIKGRRSQLAPVLGLSIGAIGTTFGTLTLTAKAKEYTHEAMGIFCLATGIPSIISSTANLVFGKRLMTNNMTFSSTGFINPDRKYIPGISLTYRF